VTQNALRTRIARRETQVSDSVLIAAVLVLGGCGGGNGGGGAPSVTPVTNASPGGIWNGTDPNDGWQVYGLVSETGAFFLIAGGSNLIGDGVTYVGTFVTQENAIDGDMAAIRQPGYYYPDRAISGTGTIGGSIVERMSVSGAVDVNTDPATSTVGGSTFTSQLSLTFSPVYNRPSALATVAGNFALGTSVLSVSNDGAVFALDPGGCVINGTVSIVDARYNMYDASLTFTGCAGIANGATLTGLATLDNSVSPEQLVLGLSNVAGATKVAILMRLGRT
jgi:hypothetical protein